MNIVCRMGAHWPSRRRQLDLLDQQVKSHCRACGAVMVRTRQGIRVQLSHAVRGRPKRPFISFSLYAALALAALAASMVLWAGLGLPPAPVSVTVKLASGAGGDITYRFPRALLTERVEQLAALQSPALRM